MRELLQAAGQQNDELPNIIFNPECIQNMNFSMITPSRIADVKLRLAKIENFILSRVDADTTIGALCKTVEIKSIDLSTSLDSLTPILRTSLVINWKESMMRSRYDRFIKLFPHISTLSSLKALLDTTEPLHFCEMYLCINANPLSPQKNPKYSLLNTLTAGFLEYQDKFAFSSEIGAIRHWCENVDLTALKSDFIGRRHGVGPGVVENIRLNLGYSVVKPDRHVIGVMQKFLKVVIPLYAYNDFATHIGVNPRYFDCLLFEYGKAKNISGECAA